MGLIIFSFLFSMFIFGGNNGNKMGIYKTTDLRNETNVGQGINH